MANIFLPVASLSFAVAVVSSIVGSNDLVGKFYLIVNTFPF